MVDTLRIIQEMAIKILQYNAVIFAGQDRHGSITMRLEAEEEAVKAVKKTLECRDDVTRVLLKPEEDRINYYKSLGKG